MNITTEDDFDRHFTPVKNHLCDNASWDGCMFETFGDEVRYVYEQPDANVWTWIECGETEDTYLVSGRHHVNRIGYIITKEAVIARVTPQLTPLETKELQNLAFLTAARRSNATKLQQLLQEGADINTQDDDGMTALHYVAAYGARTCLRVLIKDDRCDFLIKNNNGNYASDLAMLWAKDYAVCKLLNKKQAMQVLGGSY